MATGGKPLPADIAREVFRRLARMRRPPTPDNYARVFAETAGLSYAQVQPAAAAMETLARGVLADAPAGEFARELRQALDGGRWSQAQRLIRAALKRPPPVPVGDEAPVREEGVAGEMPAAWHAEAATGGHADEVPGAAGVRTTAAPGRLLAALIAPFVDTRMGFSPDAQAELGEAIEGLRGAASGGALVQAGEHLRACWEALEASGEGPAPTIRGLHELVRLMVRNMGDLVVDDAWVREQTARIQALLDRPLGPDVLAQTARSYREFVFRQGTVKHSMDEAASSVRERTATLIDRVGGLADWSGEFALRIGDYARQVRDADDLAQMSGLLEALLAELEAMRNRFAEAQRELAEAGAQVAHDEARLREAQQALGAADGMPAEDSVTGSLARPGFERQFDFELARAQRRALPICVATLDVRAVHELAGEDGSGDSGAEGHGGASPLRRLADGLRAVLRSTDSPAAWDARTFAILMPDTSPEEAERQMIRVQRELTKRFYLEDPARGLVTFAAGIAARRPGESRADVVARAEVAMRRAGEAGRNRVWLAEEPPSV
jgi:diguanylate cyclase